MSLDRKIRCPSGKPRPLEHIQLDLTGDRAFCSQNSRPTIPRHDGIFSAYPAGRRICTLSCSPSTTATASHSCRSCHLVHDAVTGMF